MTASSGAADVLLVPELGPSLGRLTEPPGTNIATTMEESQIFPEHLVQSHS